MSPRAFSSAPRLPETGGESVRPARRAAHREARRARGEIRRAARRLILRKSSRELGLRTGRIDEELARTLMFELGSTLFTVLGEEKGVATLARVRETMAELGLDV